MSLRNLFAKKYKWPELEMNEIIKRSKILIIDDDPFPYQGALQSDSYNVEYWPGEIENAERIENGYYDLILLDLHGVGTAFSGNKKQGMGVLEYIKNRNPAQLCIAVTNEKWGIEYYSFLEKADDQMSKRQSYSDFKSNIDKLLKKRFSKDYYIDLILKQSSNLTKEDAEIFINNSIKHNKVFNNGLPKSLNLETLNNICKIGTFALNAYKFLNTVQ